MWKNSNYVILCLLTSPKYNFCYVDKTMLQVVARHWELVFYLLTSQKCDLGEFE